VAVFQHVHGVPYSSCSNGALTSLKSTLQLAPAI
jgi:hypothetical protein